MNISGYGSETGGEARISNAEDFFARIAELQGEGFDLEIAQNSLVAGGLPPDMCAPMHPDSLRAGAAMMGGIYSVGNIVDTFAEQLGPAVSPLKNTFGANAGIGYEAPQPFDIALEDSGINVEFPKGPMM